MGIAIGIDLGTTNTAVAAVRDGRAVTLEDEQGRRLIPSVVSFHPNGSVLIGQAAKERRYNDAKSTVYSVKRLIGRSWSSPEVQQSLTRFPFDLREGPKESTVAVIRGEQYALPEISAFVLRRAKQIAEARLGEKVDRAVITVPANFNDLQRAATKVAGRLAGLEVMRILNEPTAAALAYGQSIAQSERIAIYDLGGGTFDMTLLDLSGSVFEVLATSGDTALGGDDIDVLIADRIAAQLREIHRFDAHANPEAFGRLRMIAEDIKIRLSVEQEVAINVSEVAYGEGGAPLSIRFVMNRVQLEHIVKPLVQKTTEVTRFAIDTVGQRKEAFDRIILVGGSTRMPCVARAVETFFGKPPFLKVNPDEVVALGAAIQAYSLEGSKRAVMSSPGIGGAEATITQVTQVTPHSENTQVTQNTQVTVNTQVTLNTQQSTLTGQTATVRQPVPSILKGAVTRVGAPPPLPTRPSKPSERVQLKEEEDAFAGFESLPRGPSTNPGITTATTSGFDLDEPDVVDEGSKPFRAPAPPAPTVDDEPSMSFKVPEPELDEITFTKRAPSLVEEDHRDPSIQSFTAPMPMPVAPPNAPPPRLPVSPPHTAIRPAQPQPWVVPPPSAVPPPPQPRPRAADDGIQAHVAPLLIDVTPLSLSVETVGGFCDVLIPANSPVPCDRTRTFLTASDGQRMVCVNVAQGESRRFHENTFLGQVELTGIEPKKRGEVAIAVTFEIDADGILNVRARDVSSGHERHAQMRLLGGSTADEVSAMLARQARHEVQ